LNKSQKWYRSEREKVIRGGHLIHSEQGQDDQGVACKLLEEAGKRWIKINDDEYSQVSW